MVVSPHSSGPEPQGRKPEPEDPPSSYRTGPAGHDATGEAAKVGLDFDEVFRAHFSRVARTIRSLGVDAAWVDDAVQDVFVIVHEKLPEFEGRSTLATWIYAVTYRVAQNHRRKRRLRIHEPLSGSEPDDSANPAESYAQDQAHRFVQRFCETLGESKRDAFVFCVVEERPPAEVAELLGVSPGTLYSRVSAARADFRRKLRQFLLFKEAQR